MADAESKKPENPKADARRHGDNFVAKLVPDPAKPPDLIRLAGYRGASAHHDHVRLYGNPELSIYWDIPEADVVYEQPVPSDSDPLGAVTLWIKRDSKIQSNSSQSAQGGQQQMFPSPAGTGAAAQTPALPITLTHTIPHTITPLCHSPYYFCPPVSPYPGLCASPFQHCPPSPLVICQVSPLPQCVQPVTPLTPLTPQTPPQTPPTIPTTIPTTIQTGSPVAGGAQAAAPQAFTPGAVLGGTFTHTFPPSIIAVCPSQYILHCPSFIGHCTFPSPTPHCVGPVSPTCTITQTTIPTTQGTISDPASFAQQGGGLAAAPQAASIQFGQAQGAQIQFASPIAICYRISPLYYCYQSFVYYQCHPSPTPYCYYQASPAQTITQTIGTQTIGTQSIATGSPVAGGGGGGAAQQAFTFTPITLPTHTLPTPGTIHTVPTLGPTYGPTFTVYPTPHTVTVTPVTFQ